MGQRTEIIVGITGLVVGSTKLNEEPPQPRNAIIYSRFMQWGNNSKMAREFMRFLLDYNTNDHWSVKQFALCELLGSATNRPEKIPSILRELEVPIDHLCKENIAEYLEELSENNNGVMVVHLDEIKGRGKVGFLAGPENAGKRAFKKWLTLEEYLQVQGSFKENDKLIFNNGAFVDLFEKTLKIHMFI